MEYLWKSRHRSSDLVGTVINIHNGDWVRRGQYICTKIHKFGPEPFDSIKIYLLSLFKGVRGKISLLYQHKFYFGTHLACCCTGVVYKCESVKFPAKVKYCYFSVFLLPSSESGVGAGIDSYYEYLLKGYILLGEDTYLERFNKVR